MKKLFLTLTVLLFAFTGVTRANVQQNRADQVIEQGFEDGLGDWTLNHCHSSSGPTSSYGGNTGNYAFRFYYTANYPQYLISPELDDNDGVNFTFYAARYSSNYPETFKVGYSSTTNDPTEFTWGSEVTCTTMYGAGAYQEYSYDFPAGTKYVSIACTSNDQFYMFVDDITVTATEPAPAPGGIVEVTIGDPTSTTTNANLPGYSLYDYAISQQIYTADEIGVAGTINTLTMWLKNSSSYARNINVYMKEVAATEFASNSAWESFTAADMVVSFTMPNGNATPIEVALDLSTPFEYSGSGSLAICFQDVTGQWSSGLGGVDMDASGNQAIYAYRDGTVYDPSNPGVNGTLLSKKNVIKLSIMTAGAPTNPQITFTPDPIDLGYRPNGAWMAPFQVELGYNQTTPVEVTALSTNNNFYTIDAEVPFTLSKSQNATIEISTGSAEVGEQTGEIVVLYDDSRNFATIPVTGFAYDPVEGDVVETAIEVNTFPYAGSLPAAAGVGIIYGNYDIPGIDEDAVDGVYKVTFDDDVLFNVECTGNDAVASLYNEDFNGKPGPMVDNYYTYEGPTVNPGPLSMWFNYDYTGSNTFFGTSAGGGTIFGYRITSAQLQELGLGNCAITTVEAAAREGSYYDLMILKGGETPDLNNMVYYQEFSDYTPLYFFDVNLDEPQFLGDDENLWIMFYSDSPYAAYCGKQPVDAANGKIWYTTNLETWYSNTTYTPVIYTRFLELPTGREVTVDLANMKVRESNGAAGQLAESNAEVMGVSRAQEYIAKKAENSRARATLISELYVPAGTYYLVVGSTDRTFDVNLSVEEVPAPEQAIVFSPYDGQTNVTSPFLAEWILGDYTTEMQVLFGTQYPPQDVLIDWTDYLVESTFLTDLEPNQSYFLQVNERNAVGTTEGEIVAFTTPIDGVEGFEVATDELYPGDAAVFTWTANRSHKGYNLYMDGVKVNEALITTNEYAVEGLEYNMTGYHFQVAAVYDAGESALSDAITVYMTGNGSVSGAVYDTDVDHPVANAVVGFTGIDEYDAEQYFEVTTGEDGTFTGEILAGVYTASVVTEAYDPASISNIVVNYDQLTDGIVFMTHEFYFPLSQIRATLQEEENNVLVEWSWTPAELIIDFETGDFSQFEFTQPAQYPWAITSSNAHEGSYAIKSTCEGMASATSQIEATVDVPYDGKMGFWVKVSSESNYDKFHFYIDGVEQGAALSGTVAYTYKEFDVTEGTHTYKWEYTKDSSVNSGDDCAYVDDITLYRYEAPLPPLAGATEYNFDDNTLMGWTSLDADGDGNGWVSSANPGIYHNSGVSLSGTGHNSSEAYVISGSYANQTAQALTPDNYLVSPQITAEDGAQIQFWACAQDASYAAEHFGVAVSTTTATAGAFTTIQEWTMTAKGPQGKTAEAERDIRGLRQGNWYLYTVDLSAYAGQDIWVAIRHFNCTDMFILNVDDIILATGGSKLDPRGDRSLMSYNLYRRDIQHGEDEADPTLLAEGIDADVYEYIDNAWANLPYGEYQWGIQATYEGYINDRSREEATYGFEGGLEGWTVITVNTEGGEWIHSDNNLGGYDYTSHAHGGSGFAMCYSFVDYVGSFDTDSYLVSPQKYSLNSSSSISFWADNANDSYPENFSVCVATADNPTASDFTQVWSGGAKGTGNGNATVRHQNNRYDNWRSHTVDLSSYAGQEVWIAFHDVNYDMYEIWIDDVTISYAGGVTPPPTPPTPGPTGSGLSEILWSNMIPKDMEATLTFNVSLNNGQSPVGAAVLATDGDEYSFNTTVGEGGTAELEVRKGVEYTITVELEGYSTFTTTDLVEGDQSYDVVLDEIIGNVEGLYVSPTGWAMWEGLGGGVTPGPGPGPGPSSNSFSEGFEGGLNGWTVITVNAEGGEWLHSSENLGGYDYTTHAHGGTGFAMCYSFVDYVGSFNTDSYLVTPQKYDIVAGSTLSFWADNANDDYPENFSVCVATADNPTASDFTQVWSGSAKGTGDGNATVRHQNNRYDNWRAHSIDLSAYAGQSVYIAFHDVNYDMYEVWIDDVELSAGSKGDRAPMLYKVMLDGQYDGETTFNGFQHNVEGFEEGSTHVTAVRPVYISGNGDWVEYTWTYTSCDNFEGVTDLAAAAQGNDVKLTWTMPEGTNPGPGPGPGPGTGSFSEGFESGMPDGWTVVDANNDGYTWCLTSAIPTTWTYYASLTLDWYRTGTNAICSGSYINGAGALNPDEYLVMGQQTLSAGSTLSFWAAATDASYPADHFGVFVSDDGATNWTSVQEWTLTGKKGANDGGLASRDGKGAKLGTWYNYSVDLSAYAGQKYIAIRHFNCYDQYIMCVDDIELTNGSKGNRAMWDYVASFSGTSAGQQAVCTDGTYIYTASWQSTPTGGHTFYQYTMEGDFVEGFEIAGATGIRDITTDGEYFYGTSGGATIFIMDFTTRTLVGSINCTGLTSRHISYDPERDGFWSGNWSTLALYSRTGALIQNGPAPTSAYGSAYYKDADNVEHLFLFCQPNSDCKVYDYNITTGTLGSSVVLDFSTVTPGCTGIAGGCFIGEYNGNTCWYGNSQQDPNLIGIYELEAGTPGPGPGPGPQPGGEGILGAMIFRDGEPIAFVEGNPTQYIVEGAAEENAQYGVRVVYDGELDVTYYAMSCMETVEYTGTAPQPCDPVTDLTAEPYVYNGNNGALVSWTEPAGATGYKLSVNGTVLGTVTGQPIFINFEGSSDDTYEIGVVAVYANCESDMVTVSFEWTSVNENEVATVIYPNPTNSNVTVKAAGMNHITVVNALGQVMYDADVDADELQLNLGQYNAGLYMVRISTINGVSVQRVTVVK